MLIEINKKEMEKITGCVATWRDASDIFVICHVECWSGQNMWWIPVEAPPAIRIELAMMRNDITQILNFQWHDIDMYLFIFVEKNTARQGRASFSIAIARLGGRPVDVNRRSWDCRAIEKLRCTKLVQAPSPPEFTESRAWMSGKWKTLERLGNKLGRSHPIGV